MDTANSLSSPLRKPSAPQHRVEQAGAVSHTRLALLAHALPLHGPKDDISSFPALASSQFFCGRSVVIREPGSSHRREVTDRTDHGQQLHEALTALAAGRCTGRNLVALRGQYGSLLEFLPYIEEALAPVVDFELLQAIPEKWRPAVHREVCQRKPHVIERLPERYRTDDLWILVCQRETALLGDLPAHLQTEEHYIAICTVNPRAYGLLANIHKTQRLNRAVCQRYGFVLEHVPEVHRDHDFCRFVCERSNSLSTFSYVPTRIMYEDFELCLNICSRRGHALQYVANDLPRRKELYKPAVMQTGAALASSEPYDHGDCYALHLNSQGRLSSSLYRNAVTPPDRNYPKDFYNSQDKLNLGVGNRVFLLTAWVKGLTKMASGLLTASAHCPPHTTGFIEV